MTLIEFIKYMYENDFEKESIRYFESEYAKMVTDNSDLEWSEENTFDEWLNIYDTIMDTMTCDEFVDELETSIKEFESIYGDLGTRSRSEWFYEFEKFFLNEDLNFEEDEEEGE